MDELKLWTDFEYGDLPIADVISSLHTHARLHVVTFEINDVCNLRCAYCYLGRRPTHQEGSLSTPEWREVFKQATSIHTSLIACVGKEPFLNHQGVEVLTELDELKKAGWHGRFGVINNGTLIGPYLPELASLEIDYLDMSVDGPPELHDAIRMGGGGRRGAWEKTAKAFERVSYMPNIRDVTACCVLHTGNVRSISAHVDALWQYGVRSFLFGTVDNFYKEYRADSFELVPQGILDIYRDVSKVARRYNGQGGQFVLALDHFFGSPYQDLLCDKDIINPGNIEQDENGIFYVRPEDDLDFFLKLALFPFSFWKSVRITHDGYYLTNMLNLSRPDYARYAVGNVRDENLVDLHRKALESPAFEAFWKKYFALRRSRKVTV